MKFLIAASAAAMLAASMTPAQAQSANTDTTLPESMRIQQSVTEQNARDAKRLGETSFHTLLSEGSDARTDDAVG